MISKEKIKEDLHILINRETGKSHRNLADSCRLEYDLCLDSLEMASLQIAVEDAFHFEFDPINDDFEKCFYSIGSLCQYIADKCGVK